MTINPFPLQEAIQGKHSMDYCRQRSLLDQASFTLQTQTQRCRAADGHRDLKHDSAPAGSTSDRQQRSAWPVSTFIRYTKLSGSWLPGAERSVNEFHMFFKVKDLADLSNISNISVKLDPESDEDPSGEPEPV